MVVASYIVYKLALHGLHVMLQMGRLRDRGVNDHGGTPTGSRITMASINVSLCRSI